MRKGFFPCVLMTTLLLLAGCDRGGEDQKALDLALTIRSEHLAMEQFSAQAALRADYGQRVYDYEMTVSANAEETALTLTAPELVEGIVARVKADETFLEYDTLCVETGPLTDDGLTPVSAIPALLEAVRSGYITACAVDDTGLLRMDCGDPDTPPGTGTQFVLWFDAQTHELVRGEVSRDGFRCVSCDFSPLTKE